MLANMIPDWFFAERIDLVLWLLAGGAIALLVFGADRAVDAAVKLASTLGLSKVIIGATIVSLGTTSPEAAVSVNAAFTGEGGMALGNAVGSIIWNTALIFGLCCCITRLPKDRFILHRHGWLQFGAGALLAAILAGLWLLNGSIEGVEIPRIVGAAMLVGLAAYMAVSVYWSRQHPESIPDEAKAEMKANHKGSRATGNLSLLLFGLVLIVAGSELLVGSATEICTRHGVPPAVIAVTVVAFGTSLPELVTALTSIAKGHSELLVGNIIGANILNVLFVIGASAAAVSLKVDAIFYYFLVPMMLGVLVLMRVFIFCPGNTFRRWQGAILLLAHAVFLVLALKFGFIS